IINAAPTVSLVSPPAGSLFSPPPTSIPLRAMATDADGTVVRVDFFQGETLIGSASAAPYDFEWTNVGAGRYSVTAVAIDNFGASARSAAVEMRVNAL